MNITKVIGIIVALAVVGGIAVYAMSMSNEDKMMEGDTMMKDKDTMMEGDTNMEKKDGPMMESDASMKTEGSMEMH